MEVPGELPKFFRYSNNLREYNPESVDRLTVLKNWIRRKTPFLETQEATDISDSDKIYSRYELTEIIGTSGGDWEYKFIEQLRKEDIVEKVGEKDNGTPLFVFVHNWQKKLAKELEEDETWQNEMRPISRFILEKAEGKELL